MNAEADFYLKASLQTKTIYKLWLRSYKLNSHQKKAYPWQLAEQLQAYVWDEYIEYYIDRSYEAHREIIAALRQCVDFAQIAYLLREKHKQKN